MEIFGKIWGTTSTIFKKCGIEVARIVGKKEMRCSVHKHEHKYNMFFVESGKLLINVWKNDYDLVDCTILEPLQSTTVRPGEFHSFEVLEDQTVAFEIYWVELDDSDIVRKDCGGRI